MPPQFQPTCVRPGSPAAVHIFIIPTISNHTGEPVRHRRERKRRAEARLLLRALSARGLGLFEQHQSSRFASARNAAAAIQQVATGWQCADCARKNGSVALFCQGCGIIRTSKAIDLPPRDKGGDSGGRNDGNSGDRGRSSKSDKGRGGQQRQPSLHSTNRKQLQQPAATSQPQPPLLQLWFYGWIKVSSLSLEALESSNKRNGRSFYKITSISTYNVTERSQDQPPPQFRLMLRLWIKLRGKLRRWYPRRKIGRRPRQRNDYN